MIPFPCAIQNHIKVDIAELFRWDQDHAYENSKLYKERTIACHEKKAVSRNFEHNEKVYNSLLQLFPGNFHSRWSGPFTIKEVRLYGVVVLLNSRGEEFIVNEQRVKHYWEKAEIPDSHIVLLDEPPTFWSCVSVKVMTFNKRLVGGNPWVSMYIIVIFSF